jgi:hypothetical protein
MCLCSLPGHVGEGTLYKHQGKVKRLCDCTIDSIDRMNSQLNAKLHHLGKRRFGVGLMFRSK